jgi:hypothetical protein
VFLGFCCKKTVQGKLNEQKSDSRDMNTQGKHETLKNILIGKQKRSGHFDM